VAKNKGRYTRAEAVVWSLREHVSIKRRQRARTIKNTCPNGRESLITQDRSADVDASPRVSGRHSKRKSRRGEDRQRKPVGSQEKLQRRVEKTVEKVQRRRKTEKYKKGKKKVKMESRK